MLTLPILGEGQNDPQLNECLINSENQKKIFLKNTNFAIPEPPLPTKSPSLHLIYKDALNPLAVLKKPSFYSSVFSLPHYCRKTLKKPKVGRVKSLQHSPSVYSPSPRIPLYAGRNGTLEADSTRAAFVSILFKFR